MLILHEWTGVEYTGDSIARIITYVYKGKGKFGLAEGYCILGIAPLRVIVTADVVEVVRCKDCSNWQIEWIPTIGGEEGCHYCGTMDKSTEPIFYCGKGERREDGSLH